MPTLYALCTKLFLKKEDGATMVEYGMMLAFIAIVCIAAVAALGTQTSSVFSAIAASI